jgi:hypothetical protein
MRSAPCDRSDQPSGRRSVQEECAPQRQLRSFSFSAYSPGRRRLRSKKPPKFSTDISRRLGASTLFRARQPSSVMPSPSGSSAKSHCPTAAKSSRAWTAAFPGLSLPRARASIKIRQSKAARRDTDLQYALQQPDYFRKFEWTGVVDFEGRRCYWLHGTTNWGKDNNQFYDVETGLLAGYPPAAIGSLQQ